MHVTGRSCSIISCQLFLPAMQSEEGGSFATVTGHITFTHDWVFSDSCLNVPFNMIRTPNLNKILQSYLVGNTLVMIFKYPSFK